MIEKVLLAVKPGYTNTSSVKLTKILAGRLHFSLLLYSAVHEDQVSRSQYGTAEALANIEESMLKAELNRLAEIKTHFDGLCSSVEVQACWQAPVAQGILNAADDFDADLVVISGSGHSKLGRLFMTHTDWEVIRRSKVPVLVSQESDPKPYANILAAVDPTHRHDQRGLMDDRILTISEQIRNGTNAKLILGHVYPELSEASMRTYMPPIDDYDSWQNFREAAMDKLAEKHNIDSHNTRMISGSPARGIIELADALSTDLLVMGAVSRTFRDDQVLGNAAEKVLNKLDCDLLFVPPACCA